MEGGEAVPRSTGLFLVAISPPHKKSTLGVLADIFQGPRYGKAAMRLLFKRGSLFAIENIDRKAGLDCQKKKIFMCISCMTFPSVSMTAALWPWLIATCTTLTQAQSSLKLQGKGLLSRRQLNKHQTMIAQCKYDCAVLCMTA
eukprot:1160222-Pelagomonas_calceolata.AAC.2